MLLIISGIFTGAALLAFIVGGFNSLPFVIRKAGRHIISSESTKLLMLLARFQILIRSGWALVVLLLLLYICIETAVPQQLTGTLNGMLQSNGNISANISISQQFSQRQITYDFFYFLYGGLFFYWISQLPKKKSIRYEHICRVLLPEMNKQLLIFDKTIHINTMIKEYTNKIVDEKDDQAIQAILREMKKTLNS